MSILRFSCAIAIALTSCGSDAGMIGQSGAAGAPGAGGAGGAGNAAGAGGGGSPSTATGRSLTLRATLRAEAGEASFLTPAASLYKHPVERLVGRPYYMAAFPSGFSPGNDPPLVDVWGTVPASLELVFTTPARFADGPYDMVMVVYVTTPITDAMRSGQVPPPAATGGDLASFTLSQVNVRPGDPTLEAGLVRVNVAGADGLVEIENRTPVDPMNRDQTRAAFDNTVLAVP